MARYRKPAKPRPQKKIPDRVEEEAPSTEEKTADGKRVIRCCVCDRSVVCDQTPFGWDIDVRRALSGKLTTKFLCPEHSKRFA